MKIVILLVIAIFFVSCSKVKTPKVLLPAIKTGKNKHWKEYNLFAIRNNLPILTSFSTTQFRYLKNEQMLNYNHIDVNEKELYIVTKFANVKKNDLYELKIYQPDGREYSYDFDTYSSTSGNWIKYSILSIDNFFAAKSEGMWRADVFIKGSMAASKKFYIGRKQLKKAKETDITIGILPFIDDKESIWEHSSQVAFYLSTGLLHDNNNIKTISPKHFVKDFHNHTNHSLYETYMTHYSNPSFHNFYDLGLKFNMDYLILGRASSIVKDDLLSIEITTFFLDIKNRKIIKEKTTSDKIYKSKTDSFTCWSCKRISIYDKVLSDLNKEIKKLRTLRI